MLRTEHRQDAFEKFSLFGVRLEVPISLLTPVIRKALQKGRYEIEEARSLPNLIQTGDVILEIGAGLGLISTIAAKHPDTRVYAVEADPKLIPVIKRTHIINGASVTVLHEILGKEDGTHSFFVNDAFWASSADGGFGGEPVQVKMTSFQSRLDEIKPTFLIVDIEGGEETLFDHVDLRSVHKIQIEVHPALLGGNGIKHLFDVLSAQHFFYDAQYSCHHIVVFRRI